MVATAGVVGWLGLAQVMSELAPLAIPPAGWFLALLASVSVGLGLTNLLPLLPLDGGRAALALLHTGRRHHLSGPRGIRLANATGLVVLVGVMAAVTVVDVVRVVSGQPLLITR